MLHTSHVFILLHLLKCLNQENLLMERELKPKSQLKEEKEREEERKPRSSIIRGLFLLVSKSHTELSFFSPSHLFERERIFEGKEM